MYNAKLSKIHFLFYETMSLLLWLSTVSLPPHCSIRGHLSPRQDLAYVKNKKEGVEGLCKCKGGAHLSGW